MSEKLLYTVETLAAAAEMSERTIRKLIRAGLPHFRLNGRGKVWISRDDFNRFMERHRRPKPVGQLLVRGGGRGRQA